VVFKREISQVYTYRSFGFVIKSPEIRDGVKSISCPVVLAAHGSVLAKSIFKLEVRRTKAQNEQYFCIRQH
jgi:hypothetical protein